MLIFPVLSQAQEVKTKEEVRINAQRDSTVTVSDSLATATTKLNPTAIQTDTLKKKSSLLTDVVAYKAEDYMRLSPRENRMYLYDQAQITYGDMVITAGLIILDNEKKRGLCFWNPRFFR